MEEACLRGWYEAVSGERCAERPQPPYIDLAEINSSVWGVITFDLNNSDYSIDNGDKLQDRGRR